MKRNLFIKLQKKKNHPNKIRAYSMHKFVMTLRFEIVSSDCFIFTSFKQKTDKEICSKNKSIDTFHFEKPLIQ